MEENGEGENDCLSARETEKKSERHASGSNEGLDKCKLPRPECGVACPRCGSGDTKFCYYNNYNVKQPRYLCKVGVSREGCSVSSERIWSLAAKVVILISEPRGMWVKELWSDCFADVREVLDGGGHSAQRASGISAPKEQGRHE